MTVSHPALNHVAPHQQIVPTRWTPQLLLEDALELFSDEELCSRHTLSIGTLLSIRQVPLYRAELAKMRADIRENGLTFKHKARLQAEQLLEMAFDWACDNDAPLKDRLSVLTKMVEWGELEPKKESAGAANAGFTFVVNLPGTAPQTMALQQAGRVFEAPVVSDPLTAGAPVFEMQVSSRATPVDNSDLGDAEES